MSDRQCKNQLKIVRLTVISLHGSGKFWQGQTKQEETRQDKTSRCVSQASKEGCPLVLKNAVSTSMSQYKAFMQYMNIVIT